MKYIRVTADMNDGDYVTKVTEITDEQIEEIRPVINAIGEFRPTKEHLYNWPTGELFDKDDNFEIIYGNKIDIDLLNLFNEFVPIGDPNVPGVHTIESVQIMEFVEKLL